MKILLGISGSISAYKSIDIARGLVKNGHEVKVVLTAGALKFVVPEVFTYLGVSDVYHAQEDFEHKNVLHVDLARWCDSFLIAPLSANTLSRLVRGEASDLLSSIFLALEPHKNILIFPAMNTNMLHHPFTQENLKAVEKIKTLPNVHVFPTDSGILACEEVGEGKLASVEEIIALTEVSRRPIGQKAVKQSLITTGATIAPLDPVRYLTNSSSGITGYHLAAVALSLGQKVVVVAGANAVKELELFKKHPHYKLIRVKTVDEMKESVLAHLDQSDYYLSSAAISDIEFEANDQKIKKDTMTDSLKVKKACDILKTVIEKKNSKLKIIGFAAETDLSDEILKKKMQSKPVDLLVGTKVNNGMVNHKEVQGFNVDSAYYRLLNQQEEVFSGQLSKRDLAHKIYQLIN